MRFSARASATPYKGDVKMKKLFCLIITAILLLSCGCSKAEPVEESTASPDLLAYGIYSTTSEENYDTTAPQSRSEAATSLPSITAATEKQATINLKTISWFSQHLRATFSFLTALTKKHSPITLQTQTRPTKVLTLQTAKPLFLSKKKPNNLDKPFRIVI